MSLKQIANKAFEIERRELVTQRRSVMINAKQVEGAGAVIAVPHMG